MRFIHDSYRGRKLKLLVGHFENVRRSVSIGNLLFVIWCLGFASACRTPTERMEGYEIHGIDVSHYQKEIDWEMVMSQDIDFVYIKASEGQEMKDKRFTENWKALGQQEVRRGAYHFFRPTINARKQAENYTNFVKLKKGDLPPALDVEVVDGASPEKLREGVQIWLTTVEKAYGIRPIIYTNQDFYHDHLHGYFDEYPLWIARYNKRKSPALKGKRKWTFWQYGNRGRLDGIEGNVDFNVFHGDSLALVRFCNDEIPMSE